MVSPGSSITTAVPTHRDDLAAELVGGALVLLVILVLLVGVLLRRYRDECRQLRARNTQLSIENDHWHEDFAAQAGELAALRWTLSGTGRYRLRSRAEAS